MITPTVGRVVHYYPGERHEGAAQAPFAAIIPNVHDDRCVNLMVILPDGTTFGASSVTLCQPEGGHSALTKDQGYCQWMPYQVKKTTGSESGEKAAGTETI